MSDPTGTAALRRSFNAEASRRLSKLRSSTHEILVAHDLMAARSGPVAVMIQQPGERLAFFANWFESTVNNTLGGRWWDKYLQRAYESGTAAAAKLTGSENTVSEMVPAVYRELAAREFSGIAQAMVQQTARAAAAAAIAGRTPRPMYQEVLTVLRGVGQARMKTAVDTLTVQLHNAARLAHFEQVGITRVGLVPEMLEPPRPSRFGMRRFVKHDHVHVHDATAAEAQQRVDEAQQRLAEAELVEAQAKADVEVATARVETATAEAARTLALAQTAEAAAQVAPERLRANAETQSARANIKASNAAVKEVEMRTALGLAQEKASETFQAAEQARQELAEAQLELAQATEPDVYKIRTAEDDRVCFPKFTLVRTPFGDKPIQYIRIGDDVLTRAGFKKVVQTGKRRYRGRLLLISTDMMESERVAVSAPSRQMHAAESVRLIGSTTASDRTWRRFLIWPRWIGVAMTQQPPIMRSAKTLGFVLFDAIRHRALSWWCWHNVPSFVCTSNHPIWCERNGFMPAHELVVGDVLQLVDDQRVKIGSISDLGFSNANSRPARSFEELLAMFIWFAMPKSAVNFQCDAIQGKVDDVAADLQFRNEGDFKTRQRSPNGGFDRSLSREFAIAGTRAESCTGNSGWHDAEFFTTMQAFDVQRWSAAFFRAKNLIDTARDVGKSVMERLSTTRTVPSDRVYLGFATTGTRAISIWSDLTVAIEDFVALFAAKLKWHGCWCGCRLMLSWQKCFGIRPIVYNLTIEGQPEFFANRTLAHNCRICEAAAQDTYTLDEARGLLPLHPRCRCSWEPSLPQSN